ncbi:MAG: hypothetical protein E4H01_09915, partial [Lysobacterales bacterium]
MSSSSGRIHFFFPATGAAALATAAGAATGAAALATAAGAATGAAALATAAGAAAVASVATGASGAGFGRLCADSAPEEGSGGTSDAGTSAPDFLGLPRLRDAMASFIPCVPTTGCAGFFCSGWACT